MSGRGRRAPCGQWERSRAESSGRLYYSVVPPPTADTSPAQPVAAQHPLVNGLHSFPPSATSAGGVPDTLLSGLQCGVTGTFILLSTCRPRLLSLSPSLLSSSALSMTRGVHACRGVSVTFCGGEGMVVVLHADFYFYVVLCFFFFLFFLPPSSPRFLLRAAGRRRSAAAAAACAWWGFKSERSSPVEVELTSQKQVLDASL